MFVYWCFWFDLEEIFFVCFSNLQLWLGYGGNGIFIFLSFLEKVFFIDFGGVWVVVDFFNEDNEDGLGCVRKVKERYFSIVIE